MRAVSRKKKVVVLAAAMVGIGGAAFAYWTTTGDGTGEAATGTTVAVTVNQTSTVTGLRPGGTAQALSGNFDNPNAGPVYIGAVSALVTGTDKVGCDATDYTVAGTATVNAQVAAGNGVGSWSGLTIAFNNKPAANQDACKGATVSISYSTS